MIRRFVLLLGIGLLAAGCGLWLGPMGVPPGSSPTPSPTPTPWPRSTAAKHYYVRTGPADAIVKIDGWAGPPSPATLEFMPSLVLYGDGRIVESGYSESFVPELYQYHVSPDEIQLILAAADEAGLLGPNAVYHDPETTLYDGWWTTYTVTVGGQVHEIGTYMSGESDDEALNAAQDRLAAFHQAMNNLGAFLGRKMAAEPYEPPSIRVFSSRADAVATMMVWPLDVDLATAGQPTYYRDYRCVVLSGSDLTQFRAATETAHRGTIWTDGKATYKVMARPIFPDESGCPPTDSWSAA